jgi:hypothetical protein
MTRLVVMLAVAGCAARRAEVEPPPATGASAGSAAAEDDRDDGEDEDEDEVPVPLDQLPPAVSAAIEQRWPGATLLEAEKEEGAYEVEIVTTGGERLEVELTSDGAVLETEPEE